MVVCVEVFQNARMHFTKDAFETVLIVLSVLKSDIGTERTSHFAALSKSTSRPAWYVEMKSCIIRLFSLLTSFSYKSEDLST